MDVKKLTYLLILFFAGFSSLTHTMWRTLPSSFFNNKTLISFAPQKFNFSYYKPTANLFSIKYSLSPFSSKKENNKSEKEFKNSEANSFSGTHLKIWTFGGLISGIFGAVYGHDYYQKYQKQQEQKKQQHIANIKQLMEKIITDTLSDEECNALFNDLDIFVDICKSKEFVNFFKQASKSIALKKLLLTSDLAISIFFDAINQNFTAIGPDELYHFFMNINHEKFSGSTLPLIQKNIDQLLANANGVELLIKLIDKKSSEALQQPIFGFNQQVAEFCLEVLSVNEKYIAEKTLKLVKTLIDTFPERKDQLAQLIDCCFEQLLKNKNDLTHLYWWVCFNKPEIEDILIDPLLKKSDLLINNKTLKEIILYFKGLRYRHPEKVKRSFIKNADKVSPKLFRELEYDKCGVYDQLIKKLGQHENEFDNIVKLLAYLSQCTDEKKLLDAEQKQLTFQHLLVHESPEAFSDTPWYKHYKNHLIDSYLEKKELRNMLNNLLKKAYKLEQEGYVTFFHGQRFAYRLTEEWFTKLWEIKNNQKTSNFMFLHAKPLCNDQDCLALQKQFRQKIIKRHGQTFSENVRKHVLFMNYAYFANSSNPGSSTADYVLNDNNAGRISLSLAEIFSFHNYEDIYRKFSQEIEQLEIDYINLNHNNSGTAVLIAVPKEILSKSVYLSQSGAIKSHVMINDKETNDIELIMKTLRSDPEQILQRSFWSDDWVFYNSDQLEFCLVMTQDKKGGLNPESGIQIIPFNAVGEDEWKAFKKKEEALFEKIKMAIQKETAPRNTISPAMQELISGW
ncbi:MAG: hypothetical protein WDZ41_01850 [Candidatus Babeliales bacterium]